MSKLLRYSLNPSIGFINYFRKVILLLWEIAKIETVLQGIPFTFGEKGKESKLPDQKVQ